MALSVDTLAALAVDIQNGVRERDRFMQMVKGIHQALNCDATALLRYENQQFRPLATAGLAPDVMGRRFSLDAHPRLEAIARAGDVVRFPADNDLPDPYDGLIPEQGELHVHACVGMPLFAGQTLIGALTLDGMDAHQFDDYSDEELRVLASLTAGALNNALLVEQLEQPASSFIPPHRRPEEREEMQIVGESAPLTHLKKEIAVVAPSDLSVLIMGETGTGKELVAQAVHRLSHRATQPLIYLNCAALPETVAESELFGHVKGAFTGAIHDRPGKFELADKGTLFLDEIGELPLSLQAKLLRVLQYGDLQRVGEDKALTVDVRIIAATNMDMRKAVTEGKFRADLYHRLSVFPLFVPSLQERRDDIVLLAGYFCEKCRIKFGLSTIALSPPARALLETASWPGNVRELEHAIYRAVIIAQAESRSGEIVLLPQHFSLEGETPADAAPGTAPTAPLTSLPIRSLAEATRQFQYDYIRYVYENNGKVWAKTARQLEIDPGNLHRLARKLGLK
ncbi:MULTISPECIES: nitric oxide reductase transcriptional regulator NorR [Pantoea]|uniref:nitric oxide reductase transcriptional regulator NorR n=1 Tax=Pantoea TaxID=53335 RepID=UPI0023F92618|nr:MULTISPECIES: nitric oxide reductase transcriptional regulator NorR [Pantoea]MBS6438179.1 nitric oxide reductase transcriptional regulator NorR [Pantoea sp.]MDU2731031.1 nitric oxide reductase transcriptional regulator NorR [Pantoea sp.]